MAQQTVVKRFTYVEEPYGHVVIMGSLQELEVDELIYHNCGSHPSRQTRRALFAVGKIIESKWFGVLWCGVPIVDSSDSRYPVGSTFSVEVTADEWERGCRRRVAC